MANAYQMTLLEAYPVIDMLPLDPSDVEEVERMVAADEVGDTMFEFLWRELKLADSVPSAEMLLNMAIKDMEEVLEAFRSQPGRTDFQRMLVESYTKETKFGFDLNDPEAVQAAVDADRTNDLLFSFIWRDMDGVDTSEDAIHHLSKAIEEIETVRDEIVVKLSPGPGARH